MSEQEAVLATLDDYADAYCAKDADQLMALFDDGEDISLIGTGGDELCAGQSAIKAVFLRNFSEATATKFEWGWQQVTVREDYAVVAVAVTIHLIINGDSVIVPVRWTVSLVRREGQWRWLHRHASAAADSQEEGSAYPTK